MEATKRFEVQAMLIKMKKASDIKSSDITPQSAYLDRRRFLSSAVIASTGLATTSLLLPAIAEAATPKVAFKDLVKSKRGLTIQAYMGLIMQKNKGKVDGKEVMDILKKLL